MTKGNCLAVIRKSLGVHTDDYMGDMNQNYWKKRNPKTYYNSNYFLSIISYLDELRNCYIITVLTEYTSEELYSPKHENETVSSDSKNLHSDI